MEPPDGGSYGGICGLVGFLDDEKYRDALTVDLMRVGRSIHQAGSPALSWLEVRAFIKHAPPSSALRAVTDPLAEFASPTAMMSALALDALHGANWQRGGGKGARPKPVLEQLRKQAEKRREAVEDDMNPSQAADVRAELVRRMRKKK